MTHSNTLLFFIFLLLLLEVACTPSGQLDPNTRQQVKTMRAGMNTLMTKPIVMIYDFNQETFSLEYRAVEVKNPTGNKMEDLVNTFLATQHFGDTPTDLRLKSISKIKQQTVLDFSGTPDFANSTDRSLFIDALEMTIARNTNLTNFLIKNI